MLPYELLQFSGVVHQAAVDPLANTIQDFSGGAHADIGGDESVLELFEKLRTDLFLTRNEILDALHKARAGFLNTGLEPVKQVGFLRYRAEESLDCHAGDYLIVSSRVRKARSSSLSAASDDVGKPQPLKRIELTEALWRRQFGEDISPSAWFRSRYVCIGPLVQRRSAF